MNPLREAVNEVMHYQFTNTRTAMHALQVLIDEADAAADEIERLREALQMLYDETADYIQRNNLGGMDNHCMRLARAALARACTPNVGAERRP
jgi:hypothetical protein